MWTDRQPGRRMITVEAGRWYIDARYNLYFYTCLEWSITKSQNHALPGLSSCLSTFWNKGRPRRKGAQSCDISYLHMKYWKALDFTRILIPDGREDMLTFQFSYASTHSLTAYFMNGSNQGIHAQG